ncbi:MAG: transcriptional repressor [Chloroflexi bacterium]|nr:MAG: transcriptional repressor [Chloroflexota bacterium]
MDDQLGVFSNRLQQHGYRLTTARRVILEALLASGGHITADGLVEVVRQQSPGIGRMTVYRTLEILSELGLIRPVYQGTGAAHYILMENGHHHHLVCSGCDRVIEFDECVLEEMGRLISGRFDFQIQGHVVEFFGLCADCRRVSA